MLIMSEDKDEIKPNLGGRPTKYGDDILKLAYDYLDNWESLGDRIPQLVGLAIHCDIADDTLFKWEKEVGKEEFSDIVTRVRQYQHKNLVNGGIDGSFNPVITKLLLCKHGHSDRQEIDHTTGGEQIQSIPVHKFVTGE